MKNVFSFSILFSVFIISSGFITPASNDKIEVQKEEGGFTFPEFLSCFEKTELPLNLGIQEIENYNTKINQSRLTKDNSKFTQQAIMSSYLPELAQLRMSRMGPPKVYPVARFYPTDKMVAVIYATYLAHSNEFQKNYKIAFFDLNGKHLSNNALKKTKKKNRFSDGHFIAGIFIKTSQTVKIDKSLNVWKNTYENVWKDDIQNKGINDNKIVDYKLQETEVFKITNDGALEVLKEYPTTAKATIH